MHSLSLSDCSSTFTLNFEYFLESHHFCQEPTFPAINHPKSLTFLITRSEFGNPSCSSNMLQDPIGIPSCFSAGAGSDQQYETVTKSGQTLFMSVYKTQIAGDCRCITITWFKHKHLLLHGLSVSVDGHVSPEADSACKVELKPWSFWRKQGSKRFTIEHNKPLDVFWDLKSAKFNGETEPCSEYYVAVVYDQEVVLLLGDLKKDAYRKTGCRPALTDPVLVSRKEHVFGKKKFSTRLKLDNLHDQKGQFHELSIECKNKGPNLAPAMEIRIDGHLMISVQQLQWKFRGNERIQFSNVKIEVYWDIHDWLFSPGLRHALFIFKLTVPAASPEISGQCSPVSSSRSSGSVDGFDLIGGLDEFCLFLYAWKVE